MQGIPLIHIQIRTDNSNSTPSCVVAMLVSLRSFAMSIVGARSCGEQQRAL